MVRHSIPSTTSLHGMSSTNYHDSASFIDATSYANTSSTSFHHNPSTSNHPVPQPQACPPAIQITPVALVVLVQDNQYNELNAAMDAQLALIVALIANKEKESIEEVKRLNPLVDEVYSKSLPKK